MSEKLKYGYHDHISPANAELKVNGKLIKACERIYIPDLKVALFDNNHLNSNRLLLTGKDKQPITLHINGHMAQVTHPGKSAFLWLDTTGNLNKSLIRELEEEMKLQKDRNRHIHLASVGDIDSAGWQTWWTPLPERDNWLHVRLIPNCVVTEHRNPTLLETEALAGAFSKAA